MFMMTSFSFAEWHDRLAEGTLCVEALGFGLVHAVQRLRQDRRQSDVWNLSFRQRRHEKAEAIVLGTASRVKDFSVLAIFNAFEELPCATLVELKIEQTHLTVLKLD